MLYVVSFYLGILLSVLFLTLIIMILIKDKTHDLILDLLHIKKPESKKKKRTNRVEIKKNKREEKKNEKNHESPIMIKRGNETSPLPKSNNVNEETTLLINYNAQVQSFVMKENIVIVHSVETINS